MAKKTKIPEPTPNSEPSLLLKTKYISEPTVHYKVGDRVQYGLIKKSIVSKILHGGKVLILDEVVTEHNYGNPFDRNRQTAVAWHEVVPYEDVEKANQEEPICNPNIYPLNFSQRDVESLINLKYLQGVDFNPDYQRDLVWNLADKESLIESIFNYVDIGKFVFFKREFSTDRELYEIIDGKQRLTTLIEFYENRFKWRGKFYRQLCSLDRTHFNGYAVPIGFLERVDRKSILNTFVRLNTGGKPQDPEHLQKVKEMLKVSK